MSSTPPDPAPEGSSDWLTRARHIVFGTAATFVEMIEDPQKREENWGKMSMDLTDLAEELAAKGQLTEAEAIRQIQEQQQRQQQADPSSAPDPHDAPRDRRDQRDHPAQPDQPPQSPPPEPTDRSPERSSSPPQPTPDRDPAGPDRPSPMGTPPRSQTPPPPPPAPDPPVSSQGQPVSADDISALMDLTREVERLRRDLEEKRASRSDTQDQS